MEERFLRREHRDQLVIDAEPASLVDRLAAWEPGDVDKWLNRRES